MTLASGGEMAAFHFPPGATAWAAGEAQLEIWRSPEGRRLSPYFALLETHVRPDGRSLRSIPPPRRATVLSRLLGWQPRLTDRLTGRRLRCDLLIAGECRRRETEYRLMTRIVHAAAQAGLSVLYLVNGNEEERARIEDCVRTHGLEKQVLIGGLLPSAGSLSARVMEARGRLAAYGDWHALADRLPEGVEISEEAYDAMAGIAAVRLAWQRLRERLEFRTALVRCHFTPLGASIAETEMDRPSTVVTTQHGVICSPTWFPILADRYICFGPSSAGFARQLDADIARQASRETVCAEYLPSGSLYDALPALRPLEQPRTLLVIDQNTRRGSQLLGMQEQNREFAAAIERALERCRKLERVIVRPHPDNPEREGWTHLAERFAGQVEFSRPGSRLEDDLAACSAVAGMFSGAVVTAAACGLPSVFVRREGWYYTGDLECFRDPLFTHPEALPERLDDILASREALQHWSAASRNAAKLYYQDGAECRFDRDWAERALNPRTR